MPFQKENLNGVLVKKAATEWETERGNTDPEGWRVQLDKPWLSLAAGNYLHTNAAPGRNPAGTQRKMRTADWRNIKQKAKRLYFWYYWLQD